MSLFSGDNLQPVSVRILDKVYPQFRIFVAHTAHLFMFCKSRIKIIYSKRKVDFIVTHDAPGAIKQFLYMDDNELSFIHSLFDEVVSRCQFSHWYFGRYHLDKPVPPRYTAVYKQVIKAE